MSKLHEFNLLLAKVTRFEVIDHTGRAYTLRPCGVRLALQDDGRTLKALLWKGEREEPKT